MGLVGRLREASENKALSIGEAWKLLEEAADENERLTRVCDEYAQTIAALAKRLNKVKAEVARG